MSARIYRLFIVLLISLSMSEIDAKTLDAKTEKNASLGLHLSADVFGYIYPIFVKDKYYSSELSASLDIDNRFFPTIEVGLGHTDMVSQLYEIGYRTRAPYYRVGLDYNVLYKKGNPGYIYIGARMGYTSFDYSVEAPPLVDPVWGDESFVRFSDVPCRSIWAEAVGGVRAEVAKNFYMGWTLRYKYLFYQGPISNGGPWYVPGFGTGKKMAFGATYTIGYYFNFTRKRQ